MRDILFTAVLLGCTRLEVEPARVWTGSSKHAAFGDGTLDVVAGAAEAPTVMARQLCEAQSEQPPRSDCAGEGGVVLLSFDTPSGVAAEVAATRFEERDGWTRVRWLGDVDGVPGADLGGTSEEGFFLFHGASLPARPTEGDALRLLPPGMNLSAVGACGDVDGDGQADLCLEEINGDGLAVLYGPLEQPVEEPPTATPPQVGPAVFPGDLDGDGDDELLVDPLDGGLFAWSEGALVPLDEGAVLADCLGPDTTLYGGFSAGDSDADGVPDLFDGAHLLHGPSVLAPGVAGCDALVLTTFDAGDRTTLGGATGDLDGDGVSDLVLVVADAAEEAEVQVHRGPLPPGTFDSGHAEVVIPWIGEAPFSAYGSLDVADVDGDGRDDLAVAMAAPRFSPPGMGAVYLWRGADLLPPNAR